ncbi:MAG TPA: UDP-2,4-diacetamido-2,4,6-trideoxy-beta-L-altropyranose hydrolase, partial [Myxococcales bacterium]|nr:UDP-2,4-diacetamido-2,4,6-trideoxy-beta-L-altropyranose hydrolase [Myxococcales bacterium]
PVRDIKATILVGAANHNLPHLASLCAGAENMELLTYVGNMAERLAQSDVAVGAGGTSTWERCALGLPSILVTLAENQRGNCEQAHELGAI